MTRGRCAADAQPAADPKAVDPDRGRARRRPADLERAGSRTGAHRRRGRRRRGRPGQAGDGRRRANGRRRRHRSRRAQRPDRPRLSGIDGARRGRVHRRDDQHGLRPGRRRQRARSSTARRSSPGRPGSTRSPRSSPIDLGRTPASHFTFPTLLEIAARRCGRRWPTRRSTARSSSRARTRSRRRAFCWDLVLDGPKPVVVTGAMRASDEAGFDGPANLRDAVRVAAAPQMRDAGGRRLPGGHDRAGRRRRQDAHLGARHVRQPERRLARPGRAGRGADAAGRAGRAVTWRPTAAAERVHLITATVAMDGRCSTPRSRSGPTASSSRRPAPGTPIRRCWPPRSGRWTPGSRSPSRRAVRRAAAGTAYAFPGGGATWVRAGAIPVGHLCAVEGPGRPGARDRRRAGPGAGLAALLADPEA